MFLSDGGQRDIVVVAVVVGVGGGVVVVAVVEVLAMGINKITISVKIFVVIVAAPTTNSNSNSNIHIHSAHLVIKPGRISQSFPHVIGRLKNLAQNHRNVHLHHRLQWVGGRERRCSPSAPLSPLRRLQADSANEIAQTPKRRGHDST